LKEIKLKKEMMSKTRKKVFFFILIPLIANRKIICHKISMNIHNKIRIIHAFISFIIIKVDPVITLDLHILCNMFLKVGKIVKEIKLDATLLDFLLIENLLLNIKLIFL